ncbi:MAG: peptidylprolyl isomerase [[Clostridium] spiroforme]|uniref:Peptidyl-prolyl cis-trans isomerase n=1 Tax=Thomasclavelia spiroformis TaxID=29348 RepID=A0A943I7W7_9FIRM|nr:MULTISPECIES: peptidylprolyl isomerase [Thomasclavelia]MBS5588551.1 peptidylprolyl isomerase [Thomasclavelia spiroformis]
MKKLFKFGMVMLLAISLVGCGSDDSSSNENEDLLSGNHHAVIDVKDYGVIKVELNADEAPITVTNFVKLAKDGFYDGLTFHRIIDGFMIQGGDPEGNGTGGSDKTIKGEFSENGVNNVLKHTRGAISMARSQDYDSASSQFFIMHETNASLDGQYAAFGYVYEGMDVVDKIATSVPVTDNNGTVEAQNQPVINSIKIID